MLLTEVFCVENSIFKTSIPGIHYNHFPIKCFRFSPNRISIKCFCLQRFEDLEKDIPDIIVFFEKGCRYTVIGTLNRHLKLVKILQTWSFIFFIDIAIQVVNLPPHTGEGGVYCCYVTRYVFIFRLSLCRITSSAKM